MSRPVDPNSALRDFAATRSEAAFAEVVNEFGGLVFSSALRRTGERELAEEITQSVFAILARKAAAASRHPSLAGWLFTVTKLESAKAMRSRHRHQRKIAELALENPDHESSDTWQEILPHLDDLLDGLPKQERHLLLARFVEEKSFRELARESGKTEAACKMRVKRTLEKLRTSLTARGATVSVATLGLALSAELSRALPLSLAAGLPSKALAAAASLKSTGLVTSHLIHFMNTTKTSTIALAVIAIGAVPIALQHSSALHLREELVTLQAQVQPASESSRVARDASESRSTSRTPVARLLARAQVPANGEEFLEALQTSMMEGNMGSIVKIRISLSRADEAKIASLLAEVEASEKYPQSKGIGLQMLLALSGEAQENPGESMERAIAGGLTPQNLESEMAQWLEKDEKTALAWFREKTAKGELLGKGLGDSPEAYIAAAIVKKLAKSDRRAALAFVDEVDPLNRGKVVLALADALAPIVSLEGENSWPILHDLVDSRSDIDERMAMLDVGARWVGIRDRSQVRAFLNGMDLSDLEASHALAMAATTNVFEAPEPVVDRMSWLLETVTPAERDEAVKRAIQPLTNRSGEEVTTWIETLQNGAVRDAALDGQSSALMWDRKYDEALSRAQLITDPEHRQTTTELLLKNVESINPQAARKLVAPEKQTDSAE